MTGKDMDLRWIQNYRLLKEYITQHRQLPDKKKVENRGLLNWWKYNKRMMKRGKLDEERIALLRELSNMRINKKTYCTGDLWDNLIF